MRRTLLWLLAAQLAFLPVQTALACHLPAHLRDEEPNLTAAQLSLLAHGGAHMERIEYRLDGVTPCVGGMADIFPCENIDLLAHLPLSDIGGGSGNDIWGWKDPVTDKEYALIGRSNGTAFVDMTDPTQPIYIGNLPTHASTSAWRDIKVYADHAFIVADFAGSHGMQVFDLTQLRSVASPPATFSNTAHYAGFTRSHNIVINEDTGFAYAVGSNTCSGGLHMMDISTPTSPTFAGCYSGDGYTHDAQCVTYHGPDTTYQGREICFASNEDTITIVDVTNKVNPVQVSRTGYTDSGYTHQGWLTEDHAYFVHDDELDERQFGHNTRTYLWDLADLDNPGIMQSYDSAGQSIDHNQYVRGNHTFQANYRRGLRVLNIDPAADGLTEVAYLDTYPEADGNEFQGAWSTYPFLESGAVLVSDINRGLFVVMPNLPGMANPVFRDGFESGGTDGWSSTGNTERMLLLMVQF